MKLGCCSVDVMVRGEESDIICIRNDSDTVWGVGEIGNIEIEEERGEHRTLRNAISEIARRGKNAAHPNPRLATRQKVSKPSFVVIGEVGIIQFIHKLWDGNCIKSFG